MSDRRVCRHGRAGVAIGALVWVAGSFVAACGGKAIVDGTSGAGGEGGTATTTTATVTTITTATITTATTTPTPTSECGQACLALWNCTQQDDLCPGLAGLPGEGFVQNCAETCEQSPALIALVDPSDCATTVAALAAVSPDFAMACYGVDGPMADDEDP